MSIIHNSNIVNNNGKLELIIGPMFSGKTSELIRRARKFYSIYDNNKILLINSKLDNRYSNDNSIISHNNDIIECIKTYNLTDIKLGFLNDFDVIMIDESQFFDDLLKFVNILLSLNKFIIICGLDGDDKQEIFGDILKLIPLADDIIKLKAYCKKCFYDSNSIIDAPFTNRIIRNPNTDAQKQIGSSDIFEAVCRKHIKL